MGSEDLVQADSGKSGSSEKSPDRSLWGLKLGDLADALCDLFEEARADVGNSYYYRCKFCDETQYPGLHIEHLPSCAFEKACVALENFGSDLCGLPDLSVESERAGED